MVAFNVVLGNLTRILPVLFLEEVHCILFLQQGITLILFIPQDNRNNTIPTTSLGVWGEYGVTTG